MAHLSVDNKEPRCAFSLGERPLFTPTPARPAFSLFTYRLRIREAHGNYDIRITSRASIPLSPPYSGADGYVTLSPLEISSFRRGDAYAIRYTLAEEYRRSMPKERHACALTLQCARDDQIYGGGVQFSRFNLKGKRVPIWTREQGVGRAFTPSGIYAACAHGARGSWHTTYAPLPSFITSSWWWCIGESHEFIALDLCHPRCITFES